MLRAYKQRSINWLLLVMYSVWLFGFLAMYCALVRARSFFLRLYWRLFGINHTFIELMKNRLPEVGARAVLYFLLQMSEARSIKCSNYLATKHVLINAIQTGIPT